MRQLLNQPVSKTTTSILCHSFLPPEVSKGSTKITVLPDSYEIGNKQLFSAFQFF